MERANKKRPELEWFLLVLCCWFWTVFDRTGRRQRKPNKTNWKHRMINVVRGLMPLLKVLSLPFLFLFIGARHRGSSSSGVRSECLHPCRRGLFHFCVKVLPSQIVWFSLIWLVCTPFCSLSRCWKKGQIRTSWLNLFFRWVVWTTSPWWWPCTLLTSAVFWKPSMPC